MEERSAVALANFVPCIPQEADCIAELRTCRLLGWSDNSSEEEEDDEPTKEEDGKPEGDEPEGDEHKEAEGWGEADPEPPSSSVALEQGKTELEVEPQQQSWEWGAIMDDEEPLAFDNPRSDSDATVGGRSPVRSTLQELGVPQETAIKVHTWDSEVEAL